MEGSKQNRPWRDIALVAGVALVARALYFASRASTDSFQLPLVDAGLFDKAARAFAAGRPTSPDDWVFHGVGYPAILGVIYTAFGPSVLFAKALQLAFGVGTAVLTYLVARDIFGRPTALIAGLVVAGYAPLIFLEGELLDAGWTALFAIALIFTTLKTTRTHRWQWGLAWGVLAGAAILVRATFLPFCLLVLGYLVIINALGSGRHSWASVLAAGAALSLVLLCGAYETFAQSGRFTVLPSAAGLNLFLGNNANQCGTLTLRPGLDWDLLERLPRSQGAVGLWNENDWFRHRAVEFALHSPGSFLVGLARKAGALVVSREIPRNEDVYLLRSDSLVLRAGLWKSAASAFRSVCSSLWLHSGPSPNAGESRGLSGCSSPAMRRCWSLSSPWGDIGSRLSRRWPSLPAPA